MAADPGDEIEAALWEQIGPVLERTEHDLKYGPGVAISMQSIVVESAKWLRQHGYCERGTCGGCLACIRREEDGR